MMVDLSETALTFSPTWSTSTFRDSEVLLCDGSNEVSIGSGREEDGRTNENDSLQKEFSHRSVEDQRTAYSNDDSNDLFIFLSRNNNWHSLPGQTSWHIDPFFSSE